MIHTATQPSTKPFGKAIANHRWPGANLFRNPFGELTRQERAELAVVNVEEIAAFLFSSSPDDQSASSRSKEPTVTGKVAYQLMGECGRGKTTHMLAIAQYFPRSSYVYLAEDEPCAAIPAGNPVLIDEAQRLPRVVRRQVFACGLPMVLGTHKDLSRPLMRAGYEVRTQRIGLSLSVEKLCEILNRRIQASRRDPLAAVPQLSQADAHVLLKRFGTDVRGIESYLYDIVQSQVDQHGKMRFID